MACTYDISTDRGKVRLLIGDTSTTSCHFPDTEIDAFLSMASGDLLMAASYALESWAAALTSSVYKAEKIGDYSYQKDEAGDKIKLAMKYKKESEETPVLEWSSYNLTGEDDGS